MVPLIIVLVTLCVVRWKRSDLRGYLFKILVILGALLYFIKQNYFLLSPRWSVQLFLGTIFFPRDMVLYVVVAAVLAWAYFWVKRTHLAIRDAGFALLFTYSGLEAFRVLMGMHTFGYPVLYNGPVILSFLILACWIVRRVGNFQRFPRAADLAVSCLCLIAIALPTFTAQAAAAEFVPLRTERGTIRVSKHMAESYRAAIAFMREKNAAGESVLSVPEDTSLYFLSEAYCPIRVFNLLPGVIAPGTMTEKTLREIDRKPVQYVLWSNRSFRESGGPVFGIDFNHEIGDYIRANFHPIGPIAPPSDADGAWMATVWERKSPTSDR
jgi:hypothetical protein